MDDPMDEFFDEEHLLANCLGDRALAARLVAIFLGRREEWTAGLQEAAAANDDKALRFLCHAIKGGSATLFAGPLQTAATELGTLIREGDPGAGEVRARTEALCRLLDETAAAMAAWRATLVMDGE